MVKWKNGLRDAYQESEPARAHSCYYIYRMTRGDWRAGRVWLGQEVDFRLSFSSAKVARDYINIYDQERIIIEAVTA